MNGCYVFALIDRYGAEVKAKRSLEDVQDYALAYISDQYSVECSTIDQLRAWEKLQRDVRIKFYYVNFATLDVLEEL